MKILFFGLAMACTACESLLGVSDTTQTVAEAGVDGPGFSQRGDASVDSDVANDTDGFIERAEVSPAGSDVDAVSNVDAADADACVSTCPHLGDVHCADPDASTFSRQLQVCSRVGDCLQWLDTVTCDGDEVCCDGACRSKEATACLPTGFDYYVDARNGSDDIDGGIERGTLAHPFRTISVALRAAGSVPNGKNIYVAAGNYDVDLGETFPLVLRGVSLRGAGADVVTVKGSGDLDHASAGGSFNGQYRVTLVVGDNAAATSVSGITVLGESPTPLNGQIGVMCDRGGAPSDTVGITSLDHIVVGGGYNGGIYASTSTAPRESGCHLRLTGSLITGSAWGLLSNGCGGSGLGRVPVVIEVGTEASGNTFEWLGTVDDAGGAILIWPCTARGAIVNNTIRNCPAGVVIDQSSDIGVHHFTINKNSFSRMWVAGLAAWGAYVTIDELNDNTFTNISGALGQNKTRLAVAVSVAVSDLLPAVKKARRNIITDNDQGLGLVSANNVVFGPDGPVDFGQPGDPGGNVIKCNSSATGSGGFDVVVAASGGGTIPLYGNTWDHFPPTTAPSATAANGTDIGVPDTSVPGLGTDFGQADTTPCPSGHTAGP